jgi:putative (di)nucleoside polyphosphate hydrolase
MGVKGKYRNNVCVVIRRSDGLVLSCHRTGFPKAEGWQFPQGGFRKSKGLIPEMRRELREEIGTDSVSVVAISRKTYKYDFPPDKKECKRGYAGQVQKWVLCEFTGSNSDISFSRQTAEFDDFKWITPKQSLERIVSFKKDVYRRAMSELCLL